MPQQMLPTQASQSILVCTCGQDLEIVWVNETRTRVAHKRDNEIPPCLSMSKPCPCGLDFITIIPPAYDYEIGESLLMYWANRRAKHKGKMPIGVAREYYELCHTWYAHTMRMSSNVPVPDPSKYIVLP